MGPNKMRLCDAGIREQEWAQKLIDDNKLPNDITFHDLLAHAIYDASADEIHMTIKGVCMKFKVERA